MTAMRDATVTKLSIQRIVCTGCGAEANASCNCGKAYVPKAVRAAEAVAENPQKSRFDLCNCNYGFGMYGAGYRVKIADSIPSESNIPWRSSANS